MGYLKRRQFRMSDNDMLWLSAVTVARNHVDHEKHNRSSFIRLLVQEEATRLDVTADLVSELAAAYVEIEGKRGKDSVQRIRIRETTPVRADYLEFLSSLEIGDGGRIIPDDDDSPKCVKKNLRAAAEYLEKKVVFGACNQESVEFWVVSDKGKVLHHDA